MDEPDETTPTAQPRGRSRSVSVRLSPVDETQLGLIAAALDVPASTALRRLIWLVSEDELVPAVAAEDTAAPRALLPSWATPELIEQACVSLDAWHTVETSVGNAINRMGTNVNQLTRLAHSGRTVSGTAVQRLADQLEALTRELHSARQAYADDAARLLTPLALP